MNNDDAELAHSILLERANRESSKRLNDKQKRFGSSHDIDSELAERAEVARKNRNALVELMGTYNLLIPAREFSTWRPTQRSKGQITGLYDLVEIIATNGILGWFLGNDDTPQCGHIQCFDGDVLPLFSMPKPTNGKTKPRSLRKGKSKRQILLDSL